MISRTRTRSRKSASPRRSSLTPRRVVFVAYPGVVLLDLTGPWEVFSSANVVVGGDVEPYRLELASGDGACMIRSAEGLSLASQLPIGNCRGSIDTLIVPAMNPRDRSLPTKLSLAALGRLARRSRRVASICGGAFLLAEVGLLDGRRATTHWLATAELTRRFPTIQVEPDAIYVKDGNVYTSAGVTTGIDLALSLVEEDLGREVALQCARLLVMFMRRPGGQSQFSATLRSQQTERDPINELIAWATDHPDADLSVEAMADRVHMSVRNFARVFRSEIGRTPAAFVEQLRIEAARRMLEDTDQPLAAIARACGFGSADSLRRSFQRQVKVAPSDYRQRFQVA